MSDRRPIETDIRGAGEAESPPERGADASLVPEDLFKEALSYHAAGVTVVAIRTGDDVHATTVSSFIPVSSAPPTVLVSVGGNAQVLPFFEDGGEFVVNLLSEGQRKLASVFADSFPVGASPFPDTGPPEIPDALACLHCRVASLIETPGGILVLGRVEDARVRGGKDALVHYRRSYHSVGGDEG